VVRPAATWLAQGTPVLVVRTLALTILLMSVSLLSCDLPSPDAPASGRETPASNTQVAHRGLVIVQFCGQATKDYSQALAAQATALLARSVTAMVQPASDGITVYYNLVAQTPTFAENGTPITLSIGPVPRLPAAPALTPTPTTEASNPYSSVPAVETVTAFNASVTASYQQQLEAAQEQLRTAQHQATAWAAQLTGLSIPNAPGPANMGACLALASHRFHGYQAEKYLVIAGALTAHTTTPDSAWYAMPDVKTMWIFAGCDSIQACRAGENAWAAVLSSAGVKEHLFFDPGESAGLSPLFGVPASR
jgi:hypothetical protein